MEGGSLGTLVWHPPTTAQPQLGVGSSPPIGFRGFPFSPAQLGALKVWMAKGKKKRGGNVAGLRVKEKRDHPDVSTGSSLEVGGNGSVDGVSGAC